MLFFSVLTIGLCYATIVLGFQVKRQACNCGQLCSCLTQAESPYTQIEQMWNNIPPTSLIEAQCFEQTRQQFPNFQKPNDPETQEYSRLEQQMDSEFKGLDTEYDAKEKQYDQCLKQNGLKTDNCDCPGPKRLRKRNVEMAGDANLRLRKKRQSGIGGNGIPSGVAKNGDSVYKSCIEREMNRIDQQAELIEQQESRINEEQIEQQFDNCYNQFCPGSNSGAASGNANACSALESALEQMENRYDQIEAKYDQLFAQVETKYGGGV